MFDTRYCDEWSYKPEDESRLEVCVQIMINLEFEVVKVLQVTEIRLKT